LIGRSSWRNMSRSTEKPQDAEADH